MSPVYCLEIQAALIAGWLLFCPKLHSPSKNPSRRAGLDRIRRTWVHDPPAHALRGSRYDRPCNQPLDARQFPPDLASIEEFRVPKKECPRAALTAGSMTDFQGVDMKKPTVTMSDVKEELFWSKVDKSTEAGCWQWVASGVRGYGRMHVGPHGGQKAFLAHRISYYLAGNEVPDGMLLDHICRNRGCVNPQHLRIVTNKQNQENRSGPPSTSTSGVLGVYWSKHNAKWATCVKHHGRDYRAGMFSRIEDAERAVIDLRKRLFTHNDVDRVDDATVTERHL